MDYLTTEMDTMEGKAARVFLNVNSYNTPLTQRTSLAAKIFPGVSLTFYAQMIDIIFNASGLARKGQLNDELWAEHSLRILKALENVGIKVHIAGINHIASKPGPMVFIGNHMSVLETFILPAIILPYKPVTFVVKQSLVDYPVFKHIMRTRNPIVVGRQNAREDLTQVLHQGEERLKAGLSIVVFPQSTRTVEFSREKFNTLGVKLAKRSNVAVIPVAIKTDTWGNGKWIKDFGPIDAKKNVFMEFSPPLQVEARGQETHEKILSFIEDRLRTWTAAEIGKGNRADFKK